MRRVVRLTLAALVAATVSTFSVAVAGGFTSGFTPGHTMTTTDFAAGGFDDSAGNHFQIFVQTGGVSFRARGGGVTRQPGSVVDVDAFTPDGQFFGYGCWMVPSSMISFNIQTSVSVNFDSTATGVSECPGTPLGAAFSAVPAPMLADSSVVGLVGRVAISATWVQSGSLNSRTSTMNISCGPYSALDQQTTRNFGTLPQMTATSLVIEGTDPNTGQTQDLDLSGLSGTGDFGDVSDITENLVINGPATGTCGQFGS